MSLPEGIVLEESYVLGIHIEPYRLRLNMDFVLAQGHPLYRYPESGDFACYRKGALILNQFREISWHASGLRPSVDAAGDYDYGTVDEFHQGGNFWKFVGDWGVLIVTGGELLVDFGEILPTDHAS